METEDEGRNATVNFRIHTATMSKYILFDTLFHIIFPNIHSFANFFFFLPTPFFALFVHTLFAALHKISIITPAVWLIKKMDGQTRKDRTNSYVGFGSVRAKRPILRHETLSAEPARSDPGGACRYPELKNDQWELRRMPLRTNTGSSSHSSTATPTSRSF